MRLCNSVGIIDSGYRGELIAMVDYVGKGDDCIIDVRDRYFQICMGDLSPFYVEMVDKLEDLGITERGAGGFGSTGK
jgi:dUTP pyrophosphatase